MNKSKMFTIQKQKKDTSQTEKDFKTIKNTLHREKSFYIPHKQEVILKEQNEIYEGLIRTYPIESLIKIINKMYPNSIIESESMNDSTIVNIFISDENIRNGIIKLCKTYGWDIFIYK